MTTWHEVIGGVPALVASDDLATRASSNVCFYEPAVELARAPRCASSITTDAADCGGAGRGKTITANGEGRPREQRNASRTPSVPASPPWVNRDLFARTALNVSNRRVGHSDRQRAGRPY